MNISIPGLNADQSADICRSVNAAAEAFRQKGELGAALELEERLAQWEKADPKWVSKAASPQGFVYRGIMDGWEVRLSAAAVNSERNRELAERLEAYQVGGRGVLKTMAYPAFVSVEVNAPDAEGRYVKERAISYESANFEEQLMEAYDLRGLRGHAMQALGGRDVSLDTQKLITVLRERLADGYNKLGPGNPWWLCTRYDQTNRCRSAWSPVGPEGDVVGLIKRFFPEDAEAIDAVVYELSNAS